MTWHSLAGPLLVALACGAADAAPATVCQRSSPPHTVALVELFTSEGCSSCPPADRWLSTFAAHYGPGQVVPLSRHVDYWDYIGWQDPFAQAPFSERQLAQRSAGPRACTPEVFVGLHEINWQPACADIRLAMKGFDGGALAAEARAIALGNHKA